MELKLEPIEELRSQFIMLCSALIAEQLFTVVLTDTLRQGKTLKDARESLQAFLDDRERREGSEHLPEFPTGVTGEERDAILHHYIPEYLEDELAFLDQVLTAREESEKIVRRRWIKKNLGLLPY